MARGGRKEGQRGDWEVGKRGAEDDREARIGVGPWGCILVSTLGSTLAEVLRTDYRLGDSIWSLVHLGIVLPVIWVY